MEVEEKYADLAERRQKIALREAQKFTMLHDDFDADWKPGEESHGTMTFSDEKPLPPPEDLLALKRKEAQGRAVQAIKDNAGASPWGKLLYDLAISQGWIEPE